MPSLPRSASQPWTADVSLNPPNRRVRTRRWCGRAESRGFPLSRFFCGLRHGWPGQAWTSPAMRIQMDLRESSMSAEARLTQLGIVLPEVPSPVANYVPFRLAGNLLFLSGQGPRDEKAGMLTGKVGAEVSVEEAYRRGRPVWLLFFFPARRRRGTRRTA